MDKIICNFTKIVRKFWAVKCRRRLHLMTTHPRFNSLPGLYLEVKLTKTLTNLVCNKAHSFRHSILETDQSQRVNLIRSAIRALLAMPLHIDYHIRQSNLEKLKQYMALFKDSMSTTKISLESKAQSRPIIFRWLPKPIIVVCFSTHLSSTKI